MISYKFSSGEVSLLHVHELHAEGRAYFIVSSQRHSTCSSLLLVAPRAFQTRCVAAYRSRLPIVSSRCACRLWSCHATLAKGQKNSETSLSHRALQFPSGEPSRTPLPLLLLSNSSITTTHVTPIAKPHLNPSPLLTPISYPRIPHKSSSFPSNTILFLSHTVQKKQITYRHLHPIKPHHCLTNNLLLRCCRIHNFALILRDFLALAVVQAQQRVGFTALAIVEGVYFGGEG